MTNMVNTKDLIMQLKEVREEKGLSYNQILAMVEANGDYVSKSTLSRIFTDGSEDNLFNYETTIRPIAKVLLDIENVEEDDDLDMKTMKLLLKYKMQRIEELESQIETLKADLDKEKLKSHEKLEKEREQHQKRIDFLTNQIDLKDKRMDALLEAVFKKDEQHKELLNTILSCPARKNDTACS